MPEFKENLITPQGMSKEQILGKVKNFQMGIEFLRIGDDMLDCTITSKISRSLSNEEIEKMTKDFNKTAVAIEKILAENPKLSKIKFNHHNFIAFHGGTVGSHSQPALRLSISFDPKINETWKKVADQITECAKELGLEIGK